MRKKNQIRAEYKPGSAEMGVMFSCIYILTLLLVTQIQLWMEPSYSQSHNNIAYSKWEIRVIK